MPRKKHNQSLLNNSIKKTLVLLCLCTSIISCKSKYIADSDLSTRNITGKIKAIKQVEFDARYITNKGIVKGERKEDKVNKYSNTLIRYRTDGSIDSSYELTKDDTIISKKEYDYNAKDVLVEINNYKRATSKTTSFKNGIQTEKTVYGRFYLNNKLVITSNKKNITKKKLFDLKNNLEWIETYEYDENNKLKRILIVDANNKNIGETINEYNAENLLVKVTDESYKSRRNITTYQYDANNNLSKKEVFYPESNLENDLYQKITYRYTNGKINQIIMIDYYDKISYAFIYNEAGLPTEKFEGDVHTTYDNITKSKVYKKYRFTYTFDKKGNWVKRTTFENEKVASIIERIIEYY